MHASDVVGCECLRFEKCTLKTQLRTDVAHELDATLIEHEVGRLKATGICHVAAYRYVEERIDDDAIVFTSNIDCMIAKNLCSNFREFFFALNPSELICSYRLLRYPRFFTEVYGCAVVSQGNSFAFQQPKPLQSDARLLRKGMLRVCNEAND